MDEDEAAVAQRLGWAEESRTSTQSSYRLYPTMKKPLSLFGARAYSCVLYATKGKPTEISIVFVNEGRLRMGAAIRRRREADQPRRAQRCPRAGRRHRLAAGLAVQPVGQLRRPAPHERRRSLARERRRAARLREGTQGRRAGPSPTR
ncbi:MAG: hypothetical protein WDO13_17435 [Verrucomicrobiota bacterium]